MKIAYLSSDALSANLSSVFRLIFAFMLPPLPLAYRPIAYKHAAGGCSARGARPAITHRSGDLSNAAVLEYIRSSAHPSIKLRTKYPYEHFPM
jgi:hypothetical protein